MRDRSYLEWIRKKPCAWCGRRPVEASHHHVPMNATKGVVASDHRAIPLCDGCHRGVGARPGYHQRGTIGSMDRDQTESWVEQQIARLLSEYLCELRAKRRNNSKETE